MQAEFPEKLGFLFEPHRYKVLYGGRGGAKSWGIARALILMGKAKRLRILCARELQNSMDDSVHALLTDQINSLGLNAFYDIQKTAIVGRNGTEFSFSGLRHKIDSLKSAEGIDICWVEEAQTVSKNSWEKLIPTIRKDGSEIRVAFNPELDSDETYKRFVLTPPNDAAVVKIGWQDNPWFPAVLAQERDQLKERDPDAYLNVWEGRTRQTLDGAIYAAELRKAALDGRITRVPYSREKPVDTFWDLGRADNTSIWFAQAVGLGEYRIIDFYQNRGHALDHYVKMLQDRDYVYGTHVLPHDADHELLASQRTIAQQLRNGGQRKVIVLPVTKVAEGINAARTIFPNCWFEEEKCADGLQALRHYRYDVDEHTGQYSRQPLHDDASHAADSFRYLAMYLREGKEKKIAPIKRPVLAGGSLGWMGR